MFLVFDGSYVQSQFLYEIWQALLMMDDPTKKCVPSFFKNFAEKNS